MICNSGGMADYTLPDLPYDYAALEPAITGTFDAFRTRLTTATSTVPRVTSGYLDWRA